MADTMDYESQRLQNIKDNQALLLSLGLASPSTKPTKSYATSHKALQLAAKKKRKLEQASYIPKADEGSEGDETPSRRKRLSLGDPTTPTGSAVDGSPLRRSGRSVRSIQRFKDEQDLRTGDVIDDDLDDDEVKVKRKNLISGNIPQRAAKSLGVRTQDPKQFGHIPGVEIGRTWASRIECSTDAIHAPTVAGISGNAVDGAWSIALSGGYPDDVDLGVAFTYTGCGGRDLKGTKQNPKNLRTAEQTSDQTFDWPLNAALKRSADTKKPIRVIRGFKLPSPCAPVEGYRYDGLYVVQKAWMGKGLTKGLKVCRYAFKRMEGQPELPVRDLDKEVEDLERE